MPNLSSREAFELWMVQTARTIVGSDDPHLQAFEQVAWTVWQAAWAAGWHKGWVTRIRAHTRCQTQGLGPQEMIFTDRETGP